jgi:hypothetical protein
MYPTDFYIAELLEKFISYFKKITDGHWNEIILGLISILLAFFFKKLKDIFCFLIRSIFTRKSNSGAIQIEGATIIDKNFKSQTLSIGKKRKYKAEDFYLAKIDYFCQWYGILNKWDIEREAYNKIKEEIKKAFADEIRQPKIIALIHGRGGSGKSTLLRRLAVDDEMKDFTVLWISDKGITDFYEKGINQLGNYSDKKFLVLIEDWYRIKQNTGNAREIINGICNYSNVRIIIGDRTIDNTISKEHIYDPDNNIIELSVRENKKTISKILDIIPGWKSTVDALLPDDNDYDSSLYLILWVVARTYQTKNKADNRSIIKHESLVGHFRTIVESDLRVLVREKYSGLARMLYYYGSVYSEHKTYMGFDIFLKLADYFKEEKTASKLAFTSRAVKPILDIYIHKTFGLTNATKQLPLVVFNHDLLADDGLSKVEIDGWQKFDDSIKLQILDIIVKEGDEISTSGFLYYTLYTVEDGVLSNQQKLDYIKFLFDKGNRGSYLCCIFNGSVEIADSEKEKYAFTILKDFNYDYSSASICYSLNLLKSRPEGIKAITNILSQPDFFKLPYGIVSTAMRLSNNETERQKAANDILSQPDFLKLPFNIVSPAMKISTNESIRHQAITVILSQPDFYKLPHQIVATALKIIQDEKTSTKILSEDFYKYPPEVISTALKISKDEKVIQKAAADIMMRPDFLKLSFEIVSSAMRISKNADLIQKAASDILSEPGFFKSSFMKVLTALKISKNETDKQKVATEILLQPNILKLPPEIVTAAIKISTNEDQRPKVVTYILSQPNLIKLSSGLVSMAMKVSKDEAERQKAAKIVLSQPDLFKLHTELLSTAIIISQDIDKATYFLQNWEENDWGIVFPSLFCFAETKFPPQFVVDIVNTIIDSKTNGKTQYFRYTQLLKIPFHEIPSWVEECNRIIDNYQPKYISLCNNILRSFILYPERIKNLCETILINWKTEILTPVKQLYGNPPVYGGNVKIALGHPDLILLAIQTAEEICEAEILKPGSIDEDILDIARDIKINKKLPEWKLEPAEKD